MGKKVQVVAPYDSVVLPPNNSRFRTQAITTLTDAEYAALPQATRRALSLLDGTVADPPRGNTGPIQSFQDVSNALAALPGTYVPRPASGDAAGSVPTKQADGSIAYAIPTGAARTVADVVTA